MSRAGSFRISGRLYRGDKANRRLEDLSRHVVSGSVEWNGDRTGLTPLAAEIVLDDPSVVNPLTDYLIPVLRVRYEDGRPPIERQMGLFSVDLPDESVRRFTNRIRLSGRDLTWQMMNSVLRDTYNIAPGTLGTDVLADLVAGSGVEQFSFPASSWTFPEGKSYWPGKTRLEVANEVADGMGWYDLYAGLGGGITSGPILDAAKRQPVTTIGPRDPIGEIEVLPTTTTLANVVAVVKENPSGAPIVAIVANDDPASPVSTAATNREILRREVSANVQTQAEAEALARAYLRDAESFYQVIRIRTLPGAWVAPWEVVDVSIVTDAGRDLRGRYHLRVWRVGFTPKDAVIDCELNQVVRFGDAGQG